MTTEPTETRGAEPGLMVPKHLLDLLEISARTGFTNEGAARQARAYLKCPEPPVVPMTEPTEWVMVPRASAELWRDYFKAEASKVHSPVQCVEAKHAEAINVILAAPTPPSSSGMEVVKEWEEAAFTQSVQAMKREGDCMAAALTVQSKTIEGLERELSEEGDRHDSLLDNQNALRTTVAELRAEVANLLGKKWSAIELALAANEAHELWKKLHGVTSLDDLLARATTAEAEVERLTAKLRTTESIAETWERQNYENIARSVDEVNRVTAALSTARSRPIELERVLNVIRLYPEGVPDEKIISSIREIASTALSEGKTNG